MIAFGKDCMSASFVSVMDEVAPGVYVGGQEAAALAAAAGFVVFCVLEVPLSGEPPGSIQVPVIRIADGVVRADVYDPNEGYVWAIPESLDRVADGISWALAAGRKVLVHCGAGMERSPLAVAWWLWRTQGLRWGEAMRRVRRARPVAQDRTCWLPRAVREEIERAGV